MRRLLLIFALCAAALTAAAKQPAIACNAAFAQAAKSSQVSVTIERNGSMCRKVLMAENDRKLCDIVRKLFDKDRRNASKEQYYTDNDDEIRSIIVGKGAQAVRISFIFEKRTQSVMLSIEGASSRLQ